jgi:hypothetical protein
MAFSGSLHHGDTEITDDAKEGSRGRRGKGKGKE